MSGHADRYSQDDREKDTITPAKQALRMSGHADTIRRYLDRQRLLGYADASDALDALLAENQRKAAEITRLHKERNVAWGSLNRAEAENQRLREDMEIIAGPRTLSIKKAKRIARQSLEALAGDTE